MSFQLSRLIAPCAASVFVFIGCNGSSEPDDGTFAGGEVEVVFAGQVGDEPFACGVTYSDVGAHGSMAMGQDLRFYVSDVRLITSSGEDVLLESSDRDPWQTPEVALIDFEDGTGACEKSGNGPTNDRIVGSVPSGEYVGIAFSVSVPEDLNHGDPTTAADPLQVTAMQWNWLLGYKFMRAEMVPMHGSHGEGGAHGHHDAMGGASMDGEGHAGHALDSQFHLGSLACANDGGDAMGPPAQSCERPNRNEIRFEAFHPGREAIVVDLAAIMEHIDLSAANHCHGMPHESCEHFFDSVGLDFTTGQRKGGQSAFRVQDR